MQTTRKKLEEMPPVMILCGGKGTRLGDVTKVTPKPMVRIGKDPILWHIMNWYAAFGCRKFVLCLGYMKEVFEEYFNKHARALRKMGWEVALVDTGAESLTGGRVWRAVQKLPDDSNEFFLTYGDGLADVDIEKLLAKHRRAKRAITISGVHPISRFGEIVFKGDRVSTFSEKSRASYYINGGFMVVSRHFVDHYLTDDAGMAFEQKPMREAAESGDMTLYKHEGFWQCMDTPREYEYLNEIWSYGNAPWSR